jgi:transcriptional regulator with XRE-family HTH domain
MVYPEMGCSAGPMSRVATSRAYKALIGVLIERRKAAGVTQVVLAARLGKPQSYISKIERRERRLDVLEFCAIALAIGLPPPELLAIVCRLLPDDLRGEI